MSLVYFCYACYGFLMTATYGHYPPPKRRHWLTQARRTLLTALVLISISLGIGVTGYHYLGELSWIDALLEAAMILGGEGPIAPMNSSMVKLFASAYALYSGLMLLTTTGVLLAPWLHTLIYHTNRQAAHDAAEDRAALEKAAIGKGTARE